MSKKNKLKLKNSELLPLEKEGEEMQEDAFSLQDQDQEVEDQLEDSVEESIDNSNESVELKKIGIFQANWVEAISISPNSLSKVYNSFQSGTIVYDQKEIERLKSIGAPIKVYVEHGSD